MHNTAHTYVMRKWFEVASVTDPQKLFLLVRRFEILTINLASSWQVPIERCLVVTDALARQPPCFLHLLSHLAYVGWLLAQGKLTYHLLDKCFLLARYIPCYCPRQQHWYTLLSVLEPTSFRTVASPEKKLEVARIKPRTSQLRPNSINHWTTTMSQRKNSCWLMREPAWKWFIPK